MTRHIRFTPDETIDLDDIRQASYDEPNDALHLTFHNGDTYDIPLSSGGEIIWKALCDRAIPLYTGG